MAAATAHPEYAALLRAVLDRPGEDLPRLVLADWLEEHGEGDRAEFVRLQCEIAELDRELMSAEDCGHPTCPGCVERRALRNRERELFDTLRPALGGELPPGWGVTLPDPVSVVYTEGQGYGVARRGFVSSVACPLAAWLAHGPAVVRAHPVEAVTLIDREPVRSLIPHPFPDEFYWYPCRARMEAASHYLPAEYHPLLVQAGGWAIAGSPAVYFPTRPAALDALSAALLAWAKATDPAANPHAGTPAPA